MGLSEFCTQILLQVAEQSFTFFHIHLQCSVIFLTRFLTSSRQWCEVPCLVMEKVAFVHFWKPFFPGCFSVGLSHSHARVALKGGQRFCRGARTDRAVPRHSGCVLCSPTLAHPWLRPARLHDTALTHFLKNFPDRPSQPFFVPSFHLRCLHRRPHDIKSPFKAWACGDLCPVISVQFM